MFILYRAETEMQYLQKNHMFKTEKNDDIDRHGPRTLLNSRHLAEPFCFSSRSTVETRVADLHCFYAVPDPSFFVGSKIAICLSLASIKYAQATGEAFSPQKRTFSTTKHEMFYLFSIFVGQFCLFVKGTGSVSIIIPTLFSFSKTSISETARVSHEKSSIFWAIG
jgi:hypothetical protein